MLAEKLAALLQLLGCCLSVRVEKKERFEIFSTLSYAVVSLYRFREEPSNDLLNFSWVGPILMVTKTGLIRVLGRTLFPYTLWELININAEGPQDASLVAHQYVFL